MTEQQPGRAPPTRYLNFGSFLLGASGSVSTRVYSFCGSQPSHSMLVGRLCTCGEGNPARPVRPVPAPAPARPALGPASRPGPGPRYTHLRGREHLAQLVDLHGAVLDPQGLRRLLLHLAQAQRPAPLRQLQRHLPSSGSARDCGGGGGAREIPRRRRRSDSGALQSPAAPGGAHWFRSGGRGLTASFGCN